VTNTQSHNENAPDAEGAGGGDEPKRLGRRGYCGAGKLTEKRTQASIGCHSRFTCT
jgi:hypothetical protein